MHCRLSPHTHAHTHKTRGRERGLRGQECAGEAEEGEMMDQEIHSLTTDPTAGHHRVCVKFDPLLSSNTFRESSRLTQN